MGNVGISFGSPTSGQGFDVAGTVTQLVTNLRAVETPWKNQLSALQAQDTALTSMGTDLSSLSTALQALTDFQGVLAGKEGSSSDTAVLQLTGASPAAVAGTHTVVVSNLAQTASWYSDDVAATDTLSGTLVVNGQTITISDGTAQDSSGKVIAQNNTLSKLAAAINLGSYGVAASVITDAGGQRLSLVSNTSGKTGEFAVDSSKLTETAKGNKVGFTEPQQGKDASFSVDGIPMTSASNTVTSGIPGVTFQLLSAAPSESVQVEITNNNSQVESAVSSFVSAYNAVIRDLNTQEGHDSSGNAEPLYGNSVVAMLQEQLNAAMNFVQSSGAITSLTQLGIEASAAADGTITLNASTLDSALNSHYQDVVNFLQPSGTFTSFGGNLTNILDNLSNSAPNGSIYLALQANASNEKDLNSSIADQEGLIQTEQAQLTAELNQANQILQAIPQQLDYVQKMYSAITGYNQNGSGG